MFGKLLCKIDCHDMKLTVDDWEYEEAYGDPQGIVTRWESVYTCSRCGKEDRSVFVYDKDDTRTTKDFADEVARLLKL